MLSKGQLLLAEMAEEILRETPRGMTSEALVNAIAKKRKQAMQERVVLSVLRQLPQRFVEDEGGRWSLRVASAQPELLPTAEAAAPGNGQTLLLRRGSYVVFDLEATGQSVSSPATEIIQIAAWRWRDGQPLEPAPWTTFVQNQHVPRRIIELTQIDPAELEGAPPIAEALRAFFAYIGDLPLIAHNGASYDGPLLAATCQRHNIALPATFRVLDTLPLARLLLPCLPAHRVGTLAEHFHCAQPNAHRADADVLMLAGIVQGLEQLTHTEPSATAAYKLLALAHDPWSQLLTPPPNDYTTDEIIASFGTQLTPLLPERQQASAAGIDAQAVEAAFAQAEEQGRSRRRRSSPGMISGEESRGPPRCFARRWSSASPF